MEERLKTLEKDNEAFRKEVVINRNQVKELEMRVKVRLRFFIFTNLVNNFILAVGNNAGSAASL